LIKKIKKLDTRSWLLGLTAAAIQGGSGAVQSAVVVTVIDPKDFGLQMATLKVMIGMFIAGAFLKLMAFLNTTPVPSQVEVEMDVNTGDQVGAAKSLKIEGIDTVKITQGQKEEK
jgi:hypothetical protein